MRYKILGIVDLLIGIGQVFIACTELFFVIPKLMPLYNQTNTDAFDYVQRAYIYLGLLLLIGIINLLLGWKLLSNSRQKYFVFALISTGISLVTGGIFIGITTTVIVTPIYNLTR